MQVGVAEEVGAQVQVAGAPWAFGQPTLGYLRDSLYVTCTTNATAPCLFVL